MARRFDQALSLAVVLLGAAAAPAGAACVPTATSMCLNEDRFAVAATFRTATLPTTPARPVEITDQTGYFWFVDPGNVEIMVKVLNACTFPGAPRFWVFAAGLTNVEVVITVTDTKTGAVKTYN